MYMTAAFAANCPWQPPPQRQDAQARLAAVMDELRQARGRPVIMRGHDFVLRAPAAERQRASKSRRDARAPAFIRPPLPP